MTKRFKRHNFNPRSRVGSDGAGYGFSTSSSRFQSTLPRGERPWGALPEGLSVSISIHAPAWGATSAVPRHATQGIFQSTLPRGERQRYSAQVLKANIFQSTLPRGERLINYASSVGDEPFQSTLPRGERLVCSNCGLHTGIFQSTLPRGERPSRSGPARRLKYFNPRSRVGSDQILSSAEEIRKISIHAPAWGATCICRLSSWSRAISIHAPAWGATACFANM